MSIHRAALLSLAVLALSFIPGAPARADVRSIAPAQDLPKPASPEFYYFGQDVAIDGGNIIVLAAFEGGQSALLYRRNSNGSWVYRRTLLTVNPPAFAHGEVAMKNGLAVVQFGNEIALFEYIGSDYVRARSAVPMKHPGGVAISGNSVLIGGDNCDYDAVVYQKGSDGTWRITGKLDDNQGPCEPRGIDVELNNDYAVLHSPATDQTTSWRRNGTAMNWVPAGNLVLSPDFAVYPGAWALQKNTAVAPGNFVFRREGNVWKQTGRIIPNNHGNGSGQGYGVVYRDGVLLSTESVYYAAPYAYEEIAPGQFEQIGKLSTSDITTRHDVSGRTAVAAIQDFYGYRFDVQVFNLPTPLRPAAPVVNDFKIQDLSGIQTVSGQFRLAVRDGENVLAQTSAGGRSVALLNGTDWAGYQRVEADLSQTSPGAGWGGLIAHYTDANNYYFVGLRSNNTLGIYKRVNGVETLLREAAWPGLEPVHVAFTVEDGYLTVWTNGNTMADARDSSLTRGRAGLITSQAQVDFDNLHVAAAPEFLLLEKDYSPYANVSGRAWTELGGDWQVRQDEQGNNQGLTQRDLTGGAFSFIGTPVANQAITARIRLDQFAPSQQGAWLGLLARYVDAKNHYYVTARSSDQLQIRKQVDGVITVLASINFKAAPSPGEYIEYKFSVIGDQLQLFVNGELVMSAHDRDIAKGQYGLATYKTAATYEYVSVVQP